MGDQTPPRINGSMLKAHVNRQVRLVGKVKEGKETQIQLSDDVVVTVITSTPDDFKLVSLLNCVALIH